jgi:hypothetical protein
MGVSFSVPVGVVIAHERIGDPWREYGWRPVSVFLHAPDITEWRELRRGPDFTHYHAATLPLELHHKETPAYKLNLEDEAPSVYIVLREDPQSSAPTPVTVQLVTASPYEAQAYGEAETDSIGRVPMPDALIEELRAFVAEHHREEPFVKRQRDKAHREELHQFGQEPIFVLRERQRRSPGEGR